MDEWARWIENRVEHSGIWSIIFIWPNISEWISGQVDDLIFWSASLFKDEGTRWIYWVELNDVLSIIFIWPNMSSQRKDGWSNLLSPKIPLSSPRGFCYRHLLPLVAITNFLFSSVVIRKCCKNAVLLIFPSMCAYLSSSSFTIIILVLVLVLPVNLC